MCALFGLPSALDPDPSSWRVVGGVSVVGHRVLRPKVDRKQAQGMVREDLWTDTYPLATLGAPEDRDVVGFRLGRRWLGQGPH